MKHVKKILALVLAMIMVLGMSTIVFAATPDTVPIPGTGTITIHNAGIGETYNVYKVLDAKVGANGAIVYPGPVPEELGDCFELSSDGVNLKIIDGLSETDLFTKLKTWASTATAAKTAIKATTATVTFTGLDFGYYVVVSTMNNGAVISVTSTNPDAVTYEKNSTTPQPDKTVNGTSFSIGDTITYTVKFPGANYMQPDATGKNAKIVTKYEVKDTLPDFLSDVTVTGIKIDGTVKDVNDTNFPGVTTFGTNKKFDIPWASKQESEDAVSWTSLYNNGAEVEITYTATLTDIVKVNAANKNTVTVSPYVEDEGNPWEESWNDSETIATYAAALKKVDGSTPAKPLAGAKFKFYGLNVKKTADGVYTVTSYDPNAYNTNQGATQDSAKLGNEMEVDADGKLYIVGLKENIELKGIETEAPAGYNLLKTEVTLTPQVLTTEIFKESGIKYYDADDNLLRQEVTGSTSKTVDKNLSELDGEAVEVINNKGVELPSTGGMGTTIFYVLGAILVLGAGVLLITKRRMSR